jgi:hypothetical protein
MAPWTWRAATLKLPSLVYSCRIVLPGPREVGWTKLFLGFVQVLLKNLKLFQSVLETELSKFYQHPNKEKEHL